MSVLEVKISSEEVAKSLENAPAKYKKACGKGLRRSGRYVRDRIRRYIKDPPKTGIKHDDLPNRSSKRGESPAYQSGDLWKSIQYQLHSWDRMEVGSDDSEKYGSVRYALSLETYMNRPYIKRAVRDTYDTVLNLLQLSVDEELSR